MNHLHVTCAIIEKGNLVLAAQRSAAMSMPLKWEFPGGKIDPGESKEECLKREIHEELGVLVNPIRELQAQTYDYPSFRITLYPFVCSIEKGSISINEHETVIWLQPDKLENLDWAQADLPIVNTYLAERSKE